MQCSIQLPCITEQPAFRKLPIQNRKITLICIHSRLDCAQKNVKIAKKQMHKGGHF